MNDTELLQAWATRRDEAAFTELVRRHLGLVQASARRQVGTSPLAEDVTQAVFLVLARKAGSLGSRVVLSGWLFRTTRFVAARAVRAEQRRNRNESLAAMQPTASDDAVLPEHWNEVEPHLDAALAALPAADRDALLLRYFEGRPLRAVGERLGIQEEAAKKRVGRAVPNLAASFVAHLRGFAVVAFERWTEAAYEAAYDEVRAIKLEEAKREALAAKADAAAAELVAERAERAVFEPKPEGRDGAERPVRTHRTRRSFERSG
jgi:RNA polymerase sigma factor (sigma-70 family)